MEHWYELMLNHNNTHRELLRNAERARLANALRSNQRPAANPANAGLLGLITVGILIGVLRMAWRRPSGSRRQS
jgi:hypothetical protein